MRLSLWFGLFVAFSLGMCVALFMRVHFFTAEPVVVQEPGPTTQILVSTRTIPVGTEITAEFVAFEEVAITEVPPSALACFKQAFRRQPAFPIPAGCPICEDLLLPARSNSLQATFVPVGSQFVTLDVTHVRQGHDVFSPDETLSGLLAPDQRVDIRVVPRDETPGRLAAIRNQVLQTFSRYDTRNSGELLLENVPIHRIQQRPGADHSGAAPDSLVLMLDQNEAARLANAARRGQIRVLVNQDTRTAPLPIEFGDIFEVAQQPQTQPIQSPPPAPLPEAVTAEQPSPSDMEQPSTISAEPIPVAYYETEGVPMPVEVLPSDFLSDPFLASYPFQDIVVKVSQISENLPSNSKSFALPVLEDEQICVADVGAAVVDIAIVDAADNDGTMVSFGLPRLAPLEPTAEEISEDLALTADNESADESLPLVASEVALGSPRITQSIQFIAPGSAAPRRVETVATASPVAVPTTVASFTMLPMTPQMLPMTPQMMPMPQQMLPPVVQERVASYSPFERRAFTVPANDGDGILSPPSLLQRSTSVSVD